MAFRFHKSFGSGPFKLNLGKKGASLSVGRRGAWLNFGAKGVRASVGLPGTGLSYSARVASWAPPKSSNNYGSTPGLKRIKTTRATSVPWHVWILVAIGGVFTPSCTFVVSILVLGQFIPPKPLKVEAVSIEAPVLPIAKPAPTFEVPRAQPIEVPKVSDPPVSKPIDVPINKPTRVKQYTPEVSTPGTVRCCDGSVSGCSCGQRRGCCSRHGGVC